jgi:uncharacterized repeat protein (TIGR02543 family)
LEVFMKRGLIAGLALLVAFAMIGVTGCKDPDSSKTTKYTVKYTRGEVPTNVNLTIPADVTIEKGKKLTDAQLASPGTYEGNTFDGWYSGTTKWTSAMAVNSNLTLAAKYTPATPPGKWRVQFNLNGGQGNFPYIDVDKDPPAPLGDKFPAAKPTKTNNTFEGWFVGNEEYTATTPNITDNVTLVAKWTFAPPADMVTGAEKVALSNGSYVVYKFTIPSTSKWENYKELTAQYMIGDEALWASGNNAAGGTRLMGPYKGKDDFQFVDITQGDTVVPKAIASYNAGKNNQYILCNSVGGDWKDLDGLAAALNLEDGIIPGEWFTLTYDHTGGDKYTAGNPKYDDANLPAATATGDFYFGLGISGRGAMTNPTVQYIKNVTLVGNSGIDDLVATPVIFELAASGSDPAIKFPAFTGYPDTSGDNGAAQMAREWVGGGTPAATIPVTFTTYTITVNPNYDANATGGTAVTKTETTDRNGLLSATQLPALAKVAHTDGGDKAFLFKGWNTMADGTGTAVTTNTKFSANATIYGNWKFIEVPQATGPLVLDTPTLIGTFDTTTLGTGASGIAVYEIPAAAYERVYETIKVTYTVADYESLQDSGTPPAPSPLKLIFKACDNDSTSNWASQFGESYHDRTANGTFSWEYSFEHDGFSHIKIQDNSGADNAKGTVTVTKIEFTCAEYAPGS